MEKWLSINLSQLVLSALSFPSYLELESADYDTYLDTGLLSNILCLLLW